MKTAGTYINWACIHYCSVVRDAAIEEQCDQEEADAAENQKIRQLTERSFINARLQSQSDQRANRQAIHPSKRKRINDGDMGLRS
ncbi:hypothetical protein ACXYTJ_15775 [Gilvimarinus sp. F26214L]|uniref:hypothetical protein n=1 Tax=Gilvimarinus sp. DZF01 TaxID=3461371 RepID=UPI004045F278